MKDSNRNIRRNQGKFPEGDAPEFEQLRAVVAHLRAEDGCPWDRAQTHESLKPTCMEEAAEVICGINLLERTGNADNLKEELGDLLLQVMFHACLAEEEGLFTIDDVVRGVKEKMIRRHPHVFGDADPEKTDWEAIKKAEHAGRAPVDDRTLDEAMCEAKDLIDRARRRKGFL